MKKDKIKIYFTNCKVYETNYKHLSLLKILKRITYLDYLEFKKLDIGNYKPILIEFNHINIGERRRFAFNSKKLSIKLFVDNDMNDRLYPRPPVLVHTGDFTDISNIDIDNLKQKYIIPNKSNTYKAIFHFESGIFDEADDLQKKLKIPQSPGSLFIGKYTHMVFEVNSGLKISHKHYVEMLQDGDYWNYLLEKWESVLEIIKNKK